MTATVESEQPTVTVTISNLYACGRESGETVQVRYPRPGETMEDWWSEVVEPLTGDSHACGSSEHAVYEAKVTAAPHAPGLVGETWGAEG